MSWQIDGGLFVRRPGAVDDHSQFAAGTDGKGLADSVEATGDRFQFFHPLDVTFQRFASRAGAAGTAGIRRCHDHRERVLDHDLVVMSEGRVDDFRRFLVPTEAYRHRSSGCPPSSS